MLTDFFEEVIDQRDFGQPAGYIHAEQLRECSWSDVEATGVQILRTRYSSNRRFDGIGSAVAAFENPFQNPAVFPITGPQKLAPFVLAEPIHEVDFRHFRARRLAEFQP